MDESLRTISKTAEGLYKNDRICSAYFNENIYLNDIKTKLLFQIADCTQCNSNHLKLHVKYKL